MGLRHRSIRLRVGILIMVPVLCLIALYGFAVSLTLGNALNQVHAKSLTDTVVVPLSNFQANLNKERAFAVLMLADPSSAQLANELSSAEAQTLLSLDGLTTALNSPTVMSDAQAHEKQAIQQLLADTKNLSYIRSVVSEDAISIPQALEDYSVITNQGYEVLDAAMSQQTSVPLVSQALQVIRLDEIAQTGLEESNLLQADIARGKFPTADRALFAQLVGVRTTDVSQTIPLLDGQYRQMVDSDVPAPLSSSLSSLETTIENTPWRATGAPPQITQGFPTFEAYAVDMGKAITQAATALQNQSTSQGRTVLIQLILAAGFGLLGTVVSVALSLFIGRSLVRQLRRLRESALGLANEKLPEVIRQLRDGQPVDMTDYAAPEVDTSRDEIEQVDYAFSVVRQTAVKSAIDEARLRRGISDVFRNLAGRSQSLLHRQLTLLDGMERRATEPDELEDLFRIDHLTTRMRRHAEGLIILSGEAPARGWRQPVPLIDVLRAAVAEVEDYTRIRVLSRTRAAVAGHAVADVIHLIAELAENATVFSPPNTPVRIQGDIVGKGFAVEIEDRGLGISPERLVEINADLADPPQFDLSDSDRLGLFIGGQLAHRHGITITLQPSVYGGTTAIVLIPMALVVDEEAYVPDPALPAGSSTGQFGRHAALTGAERGRLVAGNGHSVPLVPESPAASLPSGTLAADAVVSPAALAPGEVVGDEGPLPTAGPVAPASPSGRQPPAALPTRGPRIGERAWLSAEQAQVQPTMGQSVTGEPATGERPVDAWADRGRFDRFSDPVADEFDLAESGIPGYDRPAPAIPFPADRIRLGYGNSAPAGDDDERITTADLEAMGLPVRVRQASLAPQLRESGPATPPATPPVPTEAASSPEAARNTVSALQRGWQLGRAEAAAQPAPDGATDSPAAAASPRYPVPVDDPPPVDGQDGADGSDHD
jgi:signal transduction histidine kinase